MTQEGNNTETCNEKKDRKKNGRGKDTKKQRHSKRTEGKPQPDKPVKGRCTLY